MKIQAVNVANVVFGLMALCAVGDATDEAIRSRLADVIANDHGYRSDAASVLEECGGDSNRFVHVAKMIYTEQRSFREKSRLVSLIARYAAPSDVEFLESCVSDANVGLPALSGILRVQGVCSNSVAQVARFNRIVDGAGLAPTLRQQKTFAVVNLLKESMRASPSTEGRTLAWNYACSFVTNNVDQVGLVDEAMRRADSSYGFSNRRLSLLRWINSQILPSDTKQFVTNAISELVAYPEAILPE